MSAYIIINNNFYFQHQFSDFIPKDHLAYVIDEAVEQINLEPYLRKIPNVGNPSYHPALMIKIWF